MKMDPLERLERRGMLFMKEIEAATEQGGSDVQAFYKDAVIFITGGTGFIGKQLIEKLFRSCEIRKAYVLTRPKNGKSTKERISDLLNDPVFEAVKKKKPDLESRIVCVEGDVTCLQLGINNEDWYSLVEEVDIIFHVAATIRFDAPIRTAAVTNVQATRETLALAKACKRLRSFVHISTAYCHATSHRVDNEVKEEFYTCPIPADTLLQLVETMDEDRLNAITQSLISGWPNTYTFTKAIAEELVRAENGNLPVCIVRPSIVLNAFREPVPGWLDTSCVFGPIGILFGTAMGLLRVLYVDSTITLSVVPVDTVNNAIIAAGWRTSVRPSKEPMIYNVTNRHLSISRMSETLRTKARDYVSPFTMWYCYLIETNNRAMFLLLSWLLHYIPAYIIDAAISIFKIKKPSQLKSFVYLYRKYDRLCGALQFFLMHTWEFDDSNLQRLWKTMSDADKQIYNFDVSTIDWELNIIIMVLGIRKYLLKDGCKGTEKAVARQKWYKIANFAIILIYIAIFWVCLSWIVYFVRLLWTCLL